VDNTDTGAEKSFTVLSGTWSSGTSPSGFYGANFRYASTINRTANARAQWSCSTLAAGRYEVYAWWPAAADRSKRVPYVIKNGAAVLATVNVDQTLNGGSWQLLGAYDFSAGGHAVEVNNGKTKVLKTEKTVAADAVKFVKVGP
jgi:hyaluronate lyase